MAKQNAKRRRRAREWRRRQINLSFESLERREPLAADLMSSRTGDLIEISVRDAFAGIPPEETIQFLGASLIHSGSATTLSAVGAESTTKSLASGSNALGQVFFDNSPSSGKLWFAPSTAAVGGGLDRDPLNPGWQGRVEFEFLVGATPRRIAVDATAGFTEIPNLEVESQLVVRRIQQRLNYLGFYGTRSAPLELTGRFDEATQSALQHFKAAADSSGEHAPADEDAALDARTLRWLNSTHAPRWIALDHVDDVQRPYVTSWVLAALASAGVNPNSPPFQDLIAAASAAPPQTAPLDVHEWDGHLAGMDLRIKLGELSTQLSQRVEFMTRLVEAGSLPGAGRVTAFRTSNSTLYNAFIAAAGSHAGLARLDAEVGPSDVLHIDFAPPNVEQLDAAEAQALRDQAARMADAFRLSDSFELLRTALPLIGKTGKVPPHLAAQQEQYTLASLSSVDSRLGNILRAIAGFSPTPGVSDLDAIAAAIEQADPAGVQSVAWTESEGRVDFAITYRRVSTSQHKLHLGEHADKLGMKAAFGAEDVYDVATTLDATLTVGLNRLVTPGSPPELDVQVSQLAITARANVDGGDAFNFDLRNGLLDTKVEGAEIELIAGASLVARSGFDRFTLEDVVAGGFAGVLEATAQGHDNIARAALPTSAEFLGLPSSDITLLQPDPFFGDPQVIFSDDACLGAWTNYGTELLRGYLQFVEDALGSLSRSQVFNFPVEFAADGHGLPRTTLNDVFPLVEIWRERTSAAYDDGGRFAIDTIQKLATSLDLPLVEYDPESCTLTLAVGIQKAIDPINVQFVGDIPLGPISNLQSNSSVRITAEGEIVFNVGIDLSPPGGDLQFGAATKIADLHAGKNLLELNVHGADDLQITLSNGQTYRVNFDGVAGLDPTTATLGQVVQVIRDAAPQAWLDVEYDNVLKRLILVDKSNGTLGPLQVTALNGSLIGRSGGLGIVGVDETQDGDGLFKIVGAALHGDDVRNHIFIAADAASIPRIHIELATTADDIQASARFGIVDVGVVDGSLQASAVFDARLRDPGAVPDERITLNEFLAGLKPPGEQDSIFNELTYDASAELILPLDAQLNGESMFVNGGGEPPAVVAQWERLTETPTISFRGDFTGLVNYGQMTLERICDAIIDILERLNDEEIVEKIQKPLGITFNGRRDRGFADLLETLRETKRGGLQSLADWLNSAFESVFGPGDDEAPSGALAALATSASSAALHETHKHEHAGHAAAAMLEGEQFGPLAASLESPGYVTVSRPSGTELKIALNVPIEFINELARLNVDLEALGLGDLGRIVALNGGGEFGITSRMAVKIDLGFDLSDPDDPRPFLYDSSSVDVSLLARATNVNARAAVGLLGVETRGGAFVLDRDGAGPLESPALLAFGYANATGVGRKYFDEDVFAGLDVTDATGGFEMTLPLFRLPDGAVLDPAAPALIVGSNDLADLPNSLEIVAPNFGQALEGVDLSRFFSGLADGIDGLFTVIDAAVDGVAFAAKLPVVGDQLKEAADLITRVRDETKAKLQQAGTQSLRFVRDQLYAALGPHGLDILGDDAPPSAIAVLVDGVAFNPDAQALVGIPNEVRFDFDLTQALVDSEVDLDFDIGLPMLGLDLDGAVRLQIGGSMHVGLGLSRDDGFFLDTSRANELQYQVLATLQDFQAAGSLGFLEITARDHAPGNPQTRSQVGGTFTVDLKGGGDDRLTLAEIGSLPLANIASASFDGGAKLHLDLRTSFAGNLALPSLASEFILEWDLDTANTAAGSFGSEPLIGFTNTHLDAGSAINNIVAPFLREMKNVLDPVSTVMDVLTTPIPLLSELVGDGFTLLRVIRLVAEAFVGPRMLETAEGVVRAVDQVRDLLDHVNANGEIQVRVSDFWITDVRSHSSLSQATPRQRNGGALALEDFNLDAIPGVNSVVKGVRSALSFIGGDFFPPPEFPLLENPAAAIKLLLGQDAEIITWGMPEVDTRTPIYVPSGLAGLKGDTRLQTRINVGFDTKGIRDFAKSGDVEDIFNGFYIGDNIDPVTGEDKPEFAFDANLLAAVGIISPPASPYSIAELVFDVGVGGGLRSNLYVDVIDPNQDGKVHWDELVHGLDDGFGCAFDIRGGISAELKAFAKIKAKIDLGLFSDEITLVDEEKVFTSFEFSFETICSHMVPVDDAARPASLQDGVLRLNTNDASERFVIEPLGDAASVRVTRWRGSDSVTFDYTEVATIIGHGRGGDDEILVMPGVSIPAELRGGQGKDTLQGGDGADQLFGDEDDDILYGGAGDDVIRGGIGNDTIRGDAGNDDLRGEAGDDRLEGGQGNDRLKGGDGADYLDGEDGADVLEGEAGDDTLHGRAGDDRLVGGLGSDFLSGGDGDDVLIAGVSETGGDTAENTLIGGAGHDDLFGDRGADVIWGDDLFGAAAGDDYIQAGDGNNVIRAGAGADYVYSGRGNDLVYLGDGDDVAESGDGNDEIHGGAGHDRIDAGRGNDRVYGEGGNDVLLGGAGSDELYGGDGDDLLQAGGVNTLDAARGEAGAAHVLEGGAGDDEIYGDFGVDVIRAGSGADYVVAYAGDDWIDAGAGDDVVYAGLGSDRVAGGLGRDTIYGGNNAAGGGPTIDANVIFGDLMDALDNVEPGPRSGAENADEIYGDAGNDLIYGSVGDDRIFALGGNNRVYAGWGSDVVYLAAPGGGTSASVQNWVAADPESAADAPPVDAHHDVIYGSAGRDEIFTFVGNDTVYAYGGRDDIDTGSGDDLINAGDGNKRVTAGAGRDVVRLGAGQNMVDGGDGDDHITTGAGRDVIFGGAGHDVIHSGAGDDFVVGGSGDDAIHGGAGRDVLWGGTAPIAPEQFRRDDPTYFTDSTNFVGAVWTSAVDMPRIVPVFVAGASLAGQVDDGANTIYGGDDGDWIFGGGMADALLGDAGSDYIDGGAGADDISGGAGDDVLRGGAGDDRVHGDAGVDQLYGDAGDDVLKGDASENGRIQRLFGGDGRDRLYGYSADATPAEAGLVGDELHGGAGADTIFGGVRRDTIYGDGGNDVIQGDGVFGPDYRENPLKHLVGGGDLIVGGSGQDTIYGGGGGDELWGGADDDVLEGQGGRDRSYGGGGIDQFVFDVRPEYFDSQYAAFGVNADEAFDGHEANEPGAPPLVDDNATDILLIEGTQASDTILIGQHYLEPQDGDPPQLLRSQLVVILNGRVLTADWRRFTGAADPNGVPLVEQFRISGLGGDDAIEFIRTPLTINASQLEVVPLDVSDLVARSKDWVGVIEGGGGDDAIIGSDARDRIDGGRGDDTIYGYGGDDQLWGDGGPGQGNASDHDILYGGAGNDDLLGGQGTNQLSAWSFDPSTGGQFGVFVDENGGLHPNDGDLDDNGVLDLDEDGDEDPPEAQRRNPYALEDTGLNRMLGGARGDELYGGTGLDFMYGNGAPQGETDKLLDRNGLPFDERDGGVAGDAWKRYAQSTNKLWYYGGSNLADTIHVDFVTEPGVLQGHHLITRLTENNGNFTFDAQVRLDFQATNDDGSLVWNPDDAFYGQTLVGSTPLPAAGPLPSDVKLWLLVDGVVKFVSLRANATTFATRGELVDAIQTALDVAGLHDVVAARLSGDALSFVRVDSLGGNQGLLEVHAVAPETSQLLGLTLGQRSVNAFGGSGGLASLLPPEGDFLAILIDALAGNDHVVVGPTVIKSVWTDGGAGDDTIEYVSGAPILIDQAELIPGAGRNDSRRNAYDLGVIAGNSTPSEAGGRLFRGLTIDSPTDVDWYRFRLGAGYAGFGRLDLRSLGAADGMQVALFHGDEPVLAQFVDGQLDLSGLESLSGEDYFLRIQSTLVPTVYELEFVVGAAYNATRPTATTLPETLDQYQSILGRALHTPRNGVADEAWYKFRVGRATTAHDQLLLNALRSKAHVTVTLHDGAGNPLDDDSGVPWAITALVGGENAAALPQLAPDVDYYLRVTGPAAADYELAPRLGGALAIDLSGVTSVDLADPTIVERRDLILGGDGNDVLRGGSGEDFILGGAGNDVLSGGEDRQAPDLLWGGDGDDIFQIIPDGLPLTKDSARSSRLGEQFTLLATQADRFDGGAGNDQVLFLGGDRDPQGDAIDDHVAIRWNVHRHQYEFTSRVWDTVGNRHLQETFTDATGASVLGFLQHYAYYTTIGVENTVFDLRAGNDEAHADREYLIRGSEWGFGPDVRPRRGNPDLVIRGGAGSDRLFGGAGNDVIDGGDDADVISGGEGDDTIRGQAGDDYLSGRTHRSVPDAFEYSEGASNDHPNFASVLDQAKVLPLADVVVQGSISHGDRGDWYVLKTPDALRLYRGADTAKILRSMIELDFDVPDGPLADLAAGLGYIDPDDPLGRPADPGRLLRLFAASDTDPGLALRPIPIENYTTPPEYYLIQVVNPRNDGENPPDAFASYSLRLKAAPSGIGSTTHVDASEAALILDVGLGRTPTFLPIGDFNGDGIDDFIGAIASNGPAGAYRAYIYFGTEQLNDPAFAAPDLALTFTDIRFSPTIPTSKAWAFGDFNGDGIGDIALTSGTGPTADRAHIVLGRHVLTGLPLSDGLPQLDVDLESDVMVVNVPYASLANIGDQNGDLVDDLALADGFDVYLLYGKKHSEPGGWRPRSLTPPLAAIDFTEKGTASLEGFTFTNQVVDPSVSYQATGTPETNLWTLTQRRSGDAGHSGADSLYFGRNAAGNFDVPGEQVLGRASRAIDLTGYDPLTTITLSFSYWLDTERPAGISESPYDQARVNLSIDPAFPPNGATTTLLSNDNGALGEFREWRTATIDVTGWGGQVVYLGFEFDSVDAVANNGEGFYVDDITVSVKRALATFDSLVWLNVLSAGDESRGAISVASVGDLDGDARPEFVVAANGQTSDRLLVFSPPAGPAAWNAGDMIDAYAAAARVWTTQGDLANHTLAAAGNVIGSTRPDLLVSGGTDAASWIYSGDALWAAAAGTLTAALEHNGSDGALVAVGNVDGVAGDDLAVTRIRTTDGVFPDSILRHASADVYLSSAAGGVTVASLGGAASLSVESATPYFGHVMGIQQRYNIRPAGDLNGDGVSDFVILDQFYGPKMAVYLGAPHLERPEADAAAEPIPARYQLATPLNASTVIVPPASVDLSDPLDTTHDVVNAASVTGPRSNFALGAPRGIGDVNGDGREDFAFSNGSGTYIAYGPLDLRSNDAIEDVADLIVRGTVPGTPLGSLADGRGDLDPNLNPAATAVDRDDLLFFRHDSTTLTLSLILEDGVLPRDLGDASNIRTTTINVSAAADVQVFFVRWHTDINGIPRDDVAVFESGHVGQAPRLRIYRGADIAAGGANPTPVAVINGPHNGFSRAANVGDVDGDKLDDVLLTNGLHGGLLVHGPLGSSTRSIQFSPSAPGSLLPTYPLGDIGSRAASTPDGYDDWAVYNPVSRELQVYWGSADLIDLTPMRIHSQISSGDVSLAATAGDFNGDGLADLAVIATGGTIATGLNSGAAYILWNIATKPDSFRVADAADVTLTSSSGTGYLDQVSATPFNDFNGDGLSDLAVAAAGANIVTSSGLQFGAGRAFVIFGAPSRFDVPGDADELANESIPGSGSYIQDNGTGQAESFGGLRLTSEQQERWFQLRTQGDGLAGDYISVSPWAMGPIALPAAARGAAQSTNGGPPALTPAGSFLQVGRPSSSQEQSAYLGFDLSSALSLSEDPERQVGQSVLTVDLSSQLFNYPRNLGVGIVPAEALAVGGRFFTVMGDRDRRPRLWMIADDGASVSTLISGLVNGVATPIDSIHSLKSLGDDLYFIASAPELPASPIILWKLAAGAGTPVMVASDVFFGLESLVQFGDDVVFSSGGSVLRLDPSAPTGASPLLGADFLFGHSPIQVLDAGGTPHLLFLGSNTQTGDQGLFALAAGASAPILLQSDVFGAEGSRFETVSAGEQDEVFLTTYGAGGLLRVSASGGALTAERVVFDGGFPVQSTGEIKAVGSDLFFTGFEPTSGLYKVALGSSAATLVQTFAGGIASGLQSVDFGQGPRLVFATNDYEASLGSELWISDGTAVGTRLVADLNETPVFGGRGTGSSFPNVAGGAALDGIFYFSADVGDGRGRELYRTDGTADGTWLVKDTLVGGGGVVAAFGPGDGLALHAKIVAGGDRLYFAATHMGGLAQAGISRTEIFVSDGTTLGTRRLADGLSVDLVVEALAREGDGEINERDLTSAASFPTTLRVNESTGLTSIDVTDAVREALRSGKTHLTFRLSAPGQNAVISVAVSSYNQFLGQSGLTITPAAGVLMDVVDANGRLVAAGKPLVDMRTMDAGDYFVRVYSPTAVTADQPFQIDVKAPMAGQTRPGAESDRDRIEGGDGNDFLDGNGDLDRLFGNAGRDQFVADIPNILTPTIPGPELRDFHAADDQPLINAPSEDSISQLKPNGVDPIIELDAGPLLFRVAETLGIPIIASSGKLARPIRASDMASLVDLDLSYLGINTAVDLGLRGIEYAINLRSLNLAGNPGIFSLDALTQGADRGLGLFNLRHLSIDGTSVGSLEPLEGLAHLRTLSADFVTSGLFDVDFSHFPDLRMVSVDGRTAEQPHGSLANADLATLQNLRQLRSASFRDQALTDPMPVFNQLPRLEYLFLEGNPFQGDNVTIAGTVGGALIAGLLNEGDVVTLTATIIPTLLIDTSSFQWTIPASHADVLAMDGNTVTFRVKGEGPLLVQLLALYSSQGTNFTGTAAYRQFVHNVLPTAVSAGGPYAILEGDSVTLAASANDAGTLTYHWDIDNDGDFDENVTGAAPTLTWSQIVAAMNPSLIGSSVHQLRVRASDAFGSNVSAPVSLTINNRAPSAHAGGAYQIDEGADLDLDATASFDAGGPGEALTYAWDVDNDGDFDENVAGATPTLSWNLLVALGINDSGPPRTIALRVTDRDGASSLATTQVTLRNLAPTITAAAPPAEAVEGETIVLAAAWIDAAAADSHAVAWTVTRDGVQVAASTQSTFTFTPADQGVYQVTLRVTDDENDFDERSWSVAVENRAPTAEFRLPATGVEGEAVTIEFVALQDSAADLAAGLLFSIDVNGDGTWEVLDSETPIVQRVFAENGVYAVVGRVRDGGGGESAFEGEIRIDNAAPTATFTVSPATNVFEGAGNVVASFTNVADPSPGDAAAGFLFSYDLDNDGIFEIVDVAATTQSVPVAGDGTYLIRGRVKDRDGGVRDFTASPLVVANVLPTIESFTASAPASEGSPVLFQGRFSDPGADAWSVRAIIHRADAPAGSGASVPVVLHPDKTFAFNYIFPDDHPAGYVVSVVVADDDGSTEQALPLNVANVGPSLAVQADDATMVGHAFVREISFTDPGSDHWTYRVDFGDGTTLNDISTAGERRFTLRHAYATPGSKTVTVSVSDGAAVATRQFVVEAAANPAPIVVNPIADLSVGQGFRVTSAHADLRQVFSDADAGSAALAFAITGNTNSALASPSIVDGKLILSLNPNAFGTATIEVSATDVAGNTTTDAFQVTVVGADVTAPQSAVAPLPANAIDLAIPITVVGSDPAGPAGTAVSGVVSYDLYVAIDAGSFTKFATVPADAPTAVYHATSNHTYFFRSVARDAAGNVEQEPIAPDAQIRVGDFDAPATRVSSAVANSLGLFTVQLTGSDSGGGQLRYLDLYVAVDGGAAEFIGSSSASVPDASGNYFATTTYQGRTDGLAHAYRFFSIGRDSEGNVETAPNRSSDVLVTATFAPVSLRATGIDVQQGAQQRSYIRTVDVLFSSETGLADLLLLNPFKVERFALDLDAEPEDVTPGTGTDVSGFTVSKHGDRLRLDWGAAGITGNRTSNAGDGFYRVLVDGNGDGDYADDVDAFFEFARILGDADGDEEVDAADLAIVDAQFGRRGPNLNGDVDGSFAVNPALASVNTSDRNHVNSQKSLNRRLADALKQFLDD